MLVNLGFPIFRFPDFEIFDIRQIKLGKSGFEISKKMMKVFWGDPGQNGGFRGPFLVH